uniref:Stabilizer of axonemal microtubules 2 n=1 Tax=Macrostomum lignano TaxID=282301 RepID=A0A1I8FED1_9PLAT
MGVHRLSRVQAQVHSAAPMQPPCPVTNRRPPGRRRDGRAVGDQTTQPGGTSVPHPLERPHFSTRPDSVQTGPEGCIRDTTKLQERTSTQKQGDGRPANQSGRVKARRGLQFQWELTKPDRGGPQNTWQPPRDPFGGIRPTRPTMYPTPSGPTASFKPNEAAKLSQAPLEDMTDYRQSYVPHPLERRQERERLGWSRPAVPFDGMSTFTRGTTRPRAPPPFVHQSDTYVPPEGTIDDTTTYGKDYPAHPLVRQTYSKKPDRGLPSGPFDDATDYKDNYRQWQMGSRVRAGPNQQYQPNPAPFEGQSTTSSHYVPHPLDLRRSFKPTQGAARGEEPFDGTTLYRTCRSTRSRAGGLLETNSSRFRYQGNDERGHQVYVPKDLSVGTTVTDLSKRSRGERQLRRPTRTRCGGDQTRLPSSRNLY